jgi:hypothetical protein
MDPHSKHPNWRIIAQQATVEMDSAKMSALINQLCAALDEEARRKRSTGPIASREPVLPDCHLPGLRLPSAQS